MKVLVTGAAGFIGSQLCEALVARGDFVVGLDNFEPFYPVANKRLNIESLVRSSSFRLIEACLNDNLTGLLDLSLIHI